MERPRRPRVEAIVLYHASVARLKKIQGMFGIIRHNSGPGGICKLIFAVLESQNTVFFTPYHWFSPILSSQNHHTTPYRVRVACAVRPCGVRSCSDSDRGQTAQCHYDECHMLRDSVCVRVTSVQPHRDSPPVSQRNAFFLF